MLQDNDIKVVKYRKVEDKYIKGIVEVVFYDTFKVRLKHVISKAGHPFYAPATFMITEGDQREYLQGFEFLDDSDNKIFVNSVKTQMQAHLPKEGNRPPF